MKNLIIIFSTSLLLMSCGRQQVETTPIRKDVTETVFASGVLEAKGTYQLKAQTDGYLTKINFSEGDLVEKGMVLAEIDNKENNLNHTSASQLYDIARINMSPESPALLQAQLSIQNTKRNMEHDSVMRLRYEKLWKANSIAKLDYENALLAYQSSIISHQTAIENYKKIQQEAEQQLINSEASKGINKVALYKNEITAVMSGMVYEKFKESGDYVRKGDVIATIGDAYVIYAKVNVDESNISQIKLNQEAWIELNTLKDKVYHGKVIEIYPSFDEGTQSFLCDIAFTDSLEFRIINTQLQCNIVTGVQENALLIPRNYLDEAGYVQLKGEKQKIKVTTNFVSNDWVHVLSGIDESTVLVTYNSSGEGS